MYCFEFLIAIRMLGFLTTRHSKRITLSESPATPAQTIRLSCGCQLMCKSSQGAKVETSFRSCFDAFMFCSNVNTCKMM